MRELSRESTREVYEVYTGEDYAGKGKVVICRDFETAIRMAKHLAKPEKIEIEGRHYVTRRKFKRMSSIHWQLYCDHICINKIRLY